MSNTAAPTRHRIPVSIRLDADERRAIELAAVRFRTTFGGFMRTAAILVAGELEPATKELTINRSLGAPALARAAAHVATTAPDPAAFETKSADDVLDTLLMKVAGGFEIKDASKGQVQAIVSTMNVVDREGDVMLPGAIQDGCVVKLSGYDHDVITEGLPPVGLGVISIKGDQAIMTGQYFLNTTRGRDAFETVKALGPHSEWSVGYKKAVRVAPMSSEWQQKGARRLIAGADVMEASPVFMGANALTQTIATKRAEAVDEAWYESATLEQLLAVVHDGEFAYRVAQQLGVDVDMEVVARQVRLATKGVRRILETEDPASYAELLAEEDAAEQAWLADFHAQLSGDVAHVERVRESTAIGNQVEQTLTKCASLLDPPCQPAADRRPLPDELWPVFAFAVKALALSTDPAPAIVMATTGTGGLTDEQAGAYDPIEHEIRVRIGLKHDDLIEVICHEVAHARRRWNYGRDRDAEEREVLVKGEELRDVWLAFERGEISRDDHRAPYWWALPGPAA